MAKRYRALLALFAVAFFIGVAIGVLALWRWANDIHPRNITRALANWEVEYRHVGNDDEAKHHRGILEYVEEHYRYEDMPNYRGTEVAEKLAEQRKRTMEAIRAGLREYEEREHPPQMPVP